MRYIFIMLFALSLARGVAADTETAAQEKITARLNITYVPINSIKFINSNRTYDVYDNVFYRLAVEYHVSGLLALGPALEYMNRRIEPVVTFEKDLTAYAIMLDSKIKHNLVESGRSRMTFGFGLGVLNLKEDTGQSGNGTIFCGTTGLDISLWENLGFDFVYRYQLSRVKVEYREYSYDGSSIQIGLNYRIGF